MENGVPDSCVEDLRLAVSEAAGNAVLHAFADRSEPGSVSISIAILAEAGRIDIEVRDDGTGTSRRDDSPGAGFGMSIMASLADQFEHHLPPGGGTIIAMSFAFTPRQGHDARAGLLGVV